jgi:hypothetical protein
METINFLKVGFNLNVMKNNGNQPLDCLRFATSEGMEYPEAVWLVTRLFRLDDDAVFEMEESY